MLLRLLNTDEDRQNKLNPGDYFIETNNITKILSIFDDQGNPTDKFAVCFTDGTNIEFIHKTTEWIIDKINEQEEQMKPRVETKYLSSPSTDAQIKKLNNNVSKLRNRLF